MSLETTLSTKNQGTVVVTLVGTLDTQTSAILERKLEPVLAESPPTLILDLEELRFISSSGLRILAKTKKAVKKWNGSLLIVNMQPQIKEVLDIVKALPPGNLFASQQDLDDYLLERQRAHLGESISPQG